MDFVKIVAAFIVTLAPLIVEIVVIQNQKFRKLEDDYVLSNLEWSLTSETIEIHHKNPLARNVPTKGQNQTQPVVKVWKDFKKRKDHIANMCQKYQRFLKTPRKVQIPEHLQIIPRYRVRNITSTPCNFKK